MKILYSISLITLAILSLLLGWNMGVRSRVEPDLFASPAKLVEENQKPSLILNTPSVPAVPPITLNIETDTHLKEFRSQAIKLHNQFPDIFLISGSHEEKKVALTFDDGPDEKTTPAIMEILNEFGIKATFFVTGQNAQKYPNVIQSLYNSGHQIANHSWSHARPLSLDTDELLREINDTNKTLHDILGTPAVNLRYFRPPYGLLTSEQLKVLKNLEYIAVCWSIDSMDWYTSSSEEIEKCVVDSVHPGAIVLLHSAGGENGRVNTIKALPEIITELSRQGYEFVTVDELLEQGN
jgi:Polysaccharide deacetylase.